MSGGLPVGYSWHGFACPGIQAECSYSVERERAGHELSTPILRGQSTRHLDSWRRVSVLGQTSKQDQEPQARGRRGLLPKPCCEALGSSNPSGSQSVDPRQAASQPLEMC